MVDDHNKAPTLLQEIVDTKERGAAWIFRLLIAGAITVGAWFVTSYLGDLKSSISSLQAAVEIKSAATWKAIGDVAKEQEATSKNLGVLTQSVQDNVRSQGETIDRLSHEEDQHENRIRNLELGHH